MGSHAGDKLYILATDLCIACGTSPGEAQSISSRYLKIWESEHLITFSAQRHVLVSPDNYGDTGAPEAYYDEELQTSVVYWALGIYNNTTNPKHDPLEYQRMVYATTQDFQTSMIEEYDTHYRFTKATVDGSADVVQEKSSNLTAGLADWDRVASYICTNAGTK
ncbi:hypothetical protein CFIO01_13066 [Colletotrichum fioriniae PJ7]|uniref:Uncharacterized protein n=1 Tax=Colletotrichum fioriniae PJ7 TaxID=1445577 RepID=A0A010Q461_9PEZI|nr:hypothetical protein CFIO01_13066 [Colletotrichum fioriniae PJ7]